MNFRQSLKFQPTLSKKKKKPAYTEVYHSETQKTTAKQILEEISILM